LTTVILFITTFQTINLTSSNRFKTLARAVVRAPKSTHITPILNLSIGLRSQNALNINFSLSYKVLTTTQHTDS